MNLITYKDFQEAADKTAFIGTAITRHILSDPYRIAKTADLYDRQLNETIHTYVRTIFTLTGTKVEDFTASNNKIASNFFRRLNTQRCTYLLGNGISFTKNLKQVKENGVEKTIDQTKETLGDRFDVDLKHLGYKALIHGVSFGFWNVDRLYIFPLTEFVPLWDEDTGILKAGIRFWKLDVDKPTMAVLYEEDGYTKYKSDAGINTYNFKEIQPKKKYKTIIQHTEADGDMVVGEDNYSSLPIIPMFGSDLKQSTLIGMREKIDSFDLIRSGFANDLSDCSEIYWILGNCGGMSDKELAQFRDRLKVQHIAVADLDNSSVTPYTQEIPHAARQEYLDSIRAGIYEDFGALDVHTVAAGATNDHIDAAYQAMDEEADNFEYQVIEFVKQLLNLLGIEDDPLFKRNRISNQKEQTEMIMLAADHLDEETILKKLPFITVDEVTEILAKRDAENMERMKSAAPEAEEGPSLEQEDEGGQTPV